MRLLDYAKHEMEIAWPESDELQNRMKDGILTMVNVFSAQGHSGLSANYAINVLERLLRYKPITPLTGEESEWKEAWGQRGTQQNRRCSSVFRENHDNSTAYDIDGRVFSDDGGRTFYSCSESKIPVKFPYMPKSKPEMVILKERNEVR